MTRAEQVSHDCLIEATRQLLGMWVIAEPEMGEGWWDRWIEMVAAQTGYELLALDLDPLPRGRWIAVVDNGTERGHAVVMAGEQVVWDPAVEHAGRPIKAVERAQIRNCIVAVPLDPRWAKPYKWAATT